MGFLKTTILLGCLSATSAFASQIQTWEYKSFACTVDRELMQGENACFFNEGTACAGKISISGRTVAIANIKLNPIDPRNEVLLESLTVEYNTVETNTADDYYAAQTNAAGETLGKVDLVRVPAKNIWIGNLIFEKHSIFVQCINNSVIFE